MSDSSEDPFSSSDDPEKVIKYKDATRFYACLHGEIPKDCLKCKFFTFMLCRHRHLENGDVLSSLPKEICKLIASHLEYHEDVGCNMCLERFETNDDGESECRVEFYISKRSGIRLRGYEYYDYDRFKARFLNEWGEPMCLHQFRKWHLPRKYRQMDIKLLNLCIDCVDKLHNTKEIDFIH